MYNLENAVKFYRKYPLILFLFCRFVYLFSFNNAFEIHNDNEVLKQRKMSLSLKTGKWSSEDLKTAGAFRKIC